VHGLLVWLLAAVVAAMTAPSSATASPCGDAVLRDWFDNGRIDRIYELRCYEQAREAVPHDIRDYSDAEEVIARALQAAVRGALAPGGADPSPEQPSGHGRASVVDFPALQIDDEPVAAVVESSEPSPARFPIALLAFGGLAIVLLAAGGYEWMTRRRREASPDEPRS
jgi:hypothetical protein